MKEDTDSGPLNIMLGYKLEHDFVRAIYHPDPGERKAGGKSVINTLVWEMDKAYVPGKGTALLALDSFSTMEGIEPSLKQKIDEVFLTKGQAAIEAMRDDSRNNNTALLLELSTLSGSDAANGIAGQAAAAIVDRAFATGKCWRLQAISEKRNEGTEGLDFSHFPDDEAARAGTLVEGSALKRLGICENDLQYREDSGPKYVVRSTGRRDKALETIEEIYLDKSLPESARKKAKEILQNEAMRMSDLENRHIKERQVVTEQKKRFHLFKPSTWRTKTVQPQAKKATV